MGSGLTLKKTALSFVSDIDFLDKKAVETTALKVIQSYKKRVKNESASASDLKGDPTQLIQRVQNEVIAQVAGNIKENYEGEFYIWLESTANEPDAEHMKKWGKKFQIGVGEFPGDRYGCQCGAEILVPEKSLDLSTY